MNSVRLVGGKASSRVNEGWGRLPIGKASRPDHGLGDSSHTQSFQGRQVRKRGGQGETCEECRDGSRALGSEEGLKVKTVSSDHGKKIRD
jgi:hypothetical protein